MLGVALYSCVGWNAQNAVVWWQRRHARDLSCCGCDRCVCRVWWDFMHMSNELWRLSGTAKMRATPPEYLRNCTTCIKEVRSAFLCVRGKAHDNVMASYHSTSGSPCMYFSDLTCKWYQDLQTWNRPSRTQRGSDNTDLCNSGFIVCQTQQEDTGLVDLDGHRPPSPLHLAHGGSLFGSCLSDQSLRRKLEMYEMFFSLF